MIQNKLEEEVPYELRFYAYFSKKCQAGYKALDGFLCKEVEV